MKILLSWMTTDHKEEEWEITKEGYEGIIPIGYRWRDWAAPRTEEGKRDLKNQLTSDDLVSFVNERLFRVLGGDAIIIDEKPVVLFDPKDTAGRVVREFMRESNNFMKNGVLLRQVIDVFDEINFDDLEEKHQFNEIYETMLKSLQKFDGEFFTPRALTELIIARTNPKKTDRFADFAAGTGGFLVDALKHMESQNPSIEEVEQIKGNLYGVEKKQFPYMLCVTNMLLHDIDDPNIVHGNTLDYNVREYTDEDKYDVIAMNPPYGGSELEGVQKNFPQEMRNSETANLFVIEIMYRLAEGGRAGVIVPDGFLQNDDASLREIKKKLFKEFNVHTVLRMPGSCFSPYTGIATNIIFFDNTGETEYTWFYRCDLPDGQKFSMTKNPITREKISEIDVWWDDRKEIVDNRENDSLTETWKSRCTE